MIEYRVRPVTRYVVTRFEDNETHGGSSQHGEFDNQDVAHEVAYALCRAEHERLGYPPGDERIQYPVKEPKVGVSSGSVPGALDVGRGHMSAVPPPNYDFRMNGT